MLTKKKNPCDLIILQHVNMLLGGVETYFYRIIEWASQYKIRCFIILKENAIVDAFWEQQLKKYEATIYYSTDLYPFYRIIDKNGKKINLRSYMDIFCFSTSYLGYIRGEYMKKLNRCAHFENMIYFLHPYSIRLSKKEAIDQYLTTHLLKPLSQTNRIIFMDEETRLQGIRYYPDCVDESTRIVRLGYKTGTEVTESDLKNKFHENERNICTVTRLDFPFKIYIMSLIDVFEKLSANHPETTLTIIGKGSNEREVVNRIKKLDNNIRSRIAFIKGVPYEDLNQYINNTFLYVGMGTTILDFANRSVPGIVSVAYHTGDISFGIWADRPYVLGGLLEDDIAPVNTMSQKIESILNLNEKEYIDLCRIHRRMLSENYGMDILMEELLDTELLSEVNINSAVLFFYSLFIWLRRRHKRVKKSFMV